MMAQHANTSLHFANMLQFLPLIFFYKCFFLKNWLLASLLHACANSPWLFSLYILPQNTAFYKSLIICIF